ncbi:hypothetical protein ZIOFF_020709 [Zingiber officinale]|uniref:Peptidase M28 domain-containing protein n=1 Tax=Zingiber officinale TaxID=94328 RepID=A0A8J5LLI6_ZINOF|nr:hypothetical protein ZIOFF_020709 [Zingiber officinale]
MDIVRPRNYDAFLFVDQCPTIDIACITRESEGDINTTSGGRECSHIAYKQWMQGSHGFVKTHKWSSTVGAFVNIEASGTGGFGQAHLLVLLNSARKTVPQRNPVSPLKQFALEKVSAPATEVKTPVKIHKRAIGLSDWRIADVVSSKVNEDSRWALKAYPTAYLYLVCQSGPGSWPSYIYAQSAKYPMATSVAQDMFGIIPGDTDYRIFAEDYGNIPGLDIIFVLGGYFYHTSYDTVERLLPGSIQARGENLFRLTQAFANSSDVLNANERSLKVASLESTEGRAVFFDYLSLFMVYYSRKLSIILHSMPVVILLLGAFFLHFPNTSVNIWFTTLFDFIKDLSGPQQELAETTEPPLGLVFHWSSSADFVSHGMLFHALSLVFAIVVPVMFAVLRLFFSTQAMNWFAHPILAFLMFVPSSLVGLLLPRTTWGNFGLSQKASHFKLSIEIISDEVCFWGAFALYISMTMTYLLAQLGGGFLTYLISLSMLISWFSYRIASKHCGLQSVKSLAGYLIPMIPSLLYSVYYGGFLVQFLIEKMGMMGSLPRPFGYFVQDAVVAAVIGLVTGWCVGPLLPVVGHWLGRSSVLQCLVQVTILALALSSQFFPYSVDAPKRVVLQHTFATVGSDKIVSSSYDFAVVDANSFSFLFKNAPEASKFLGISSGLSEENYNSDGGTWVALFPVSFLFSESLKFPTEGSKILSHYAILPHVSVRDSVLISETGHRRLHLELHLGSVGEIWVTVLNITGPLSNWSFADYRLPAPESFNGGPPSYICRLSGSSKDNWTFWLEANNSESLRMDVAVLDQYLVDDTQRLKSSFPSWADLTAFTTFFSSYYL